MPKLKTKERAIAKSLGNRNPYIERTFKTMLICIYVYDNIFNATHLKNVRAIYKKYSQASIVKLANILKTDERTLIRYRHQYLKCFELCEFAINYFDEIFNYILNN